MTRALIITPLRPPDPARDHHGVYQRLRMFIQALAADHDEIDIGYFAPPDDIAGFLDTTFPGRSVSAQSSSFWGTPVTVHLLPLEMSARNIWQAAQTLIGLRYRGDYRPYLGKRTVAALGRLLEAKPDLIFAHRLPMMEVLRAAAPTSTLLAPIIFDLDDVEHLVKLRAASAQRSKWQRQRFIFEARALAAAERRALERADLTFICSDSDRMRLDDAAFNVSRIAVAPNCVPMALAMPAPSGPQSALYIGNYGHPPNAEAAERLITLIWPQVRAALPQARLIIAGADPERIASFREEPDGVEFTGLVQDIDALYRRARIVCCPLVNGGGTRLKLIEAASQGLAIASTHVAAEGLALTNGREIMLRDDDVGLASACITLLTDEAQAMVQAEAAFKAVRKLYRPERVQALICEAIRQALPVPVPAQAKFSRLERTMSMADLETDNVKP